MLACLLVYLFACSFTYLLAYLLSCSLACLFTCLCACLLACLLTCLRACVLVCLLACLLACVLVCLLALRRATAQLLHSHVLGKSLDGAPAVTKIFHLCLYCSWPDGSKSPSLPLPADVQRIAVLVRDSSFFQRNRPIRLQRLLVMRVCMYSWFRMDRSLRHSRASSP